MTQKQPSLVSENQLDVSFGGCSSAGVREHNQDAFAAHKPTRVAQLNHKGASACIADGVSCSQHGQQASQTCVTQFIEDYYATPDTWGVKQAVSRVLSSLNRWLYHHSQQSQLRHNGFVSTFSAVVFKSATAHFLHVGDSRIYRYRQGKLLQITKDHCRQGLGDKGFLTRALGIDSQVEVDYQTHELQRDDIYLLSTDGVHDWLSNTQLGELLSQQTDLEQCANDIVAQAAMAGSNDNLSCLLVKVNTLPYADISELNQQLLHRVIPPVLEQGQSIDQWRVEKILYSGSRSHIYAVKSPRYQQTYLMKVPSLSYQDDLDYRKAFIREQWIGERTSSPLLMRIYPQESRFLYHLCQFVPGITLRQWMFDHPKPTLTEVRNVFSAMAAAVRALQRIGVTHRDLKPENMMLTPSGEIVLLDYGAADAQGLADSESPADAIPLGDLGYIAPEYIDGRADHQSDIFSMGVILYEMLSGERPFKKRSVTYQSSRQAYDWQYQPLSRHRQDVPFWVDQVIKRACHPDNRERYTSMSELVADLSTPNQAVLTETENAPLLVRDPVRFWQGVSGILLVIVILQLLIAFS